MVSVLLSLLMVVQLSSSLVSFDLDGTLQQSSAPQTARLEPLQRRVSFLPPTSAASSAAANGTAADTWGPIQLDSVGAMPSAMASGTVWSAPLLVRPVGSTSAANAVADPSTSEPLPFVVVASGRTLRFFSALPRSNSSEGVRREFASQPLLVSSGPAPTTAFVSEATVALCVCSMFVSTPPRPNATSSSLTSKLYLVDALGALNMVNLTQGRVSSGNKQLKAWLMSAEQTLARPERDRAGGSASSAGIVTADPCPPCSGDVLAVGSSVAPPTGLFYSPRPTASQATLIDANKDGLLDYFFVRGSIDSNVLSMAAADEPTLSRTSLGLELLPYINRGPQANGVEKFDIVRSSTTSGVSMSGRNSRESDTSLVQQSLFLEDADTATPDADAEQNMWIAARMHEGLRGTASDGVRERLRSLVSLPDGATRPNYFAVGPINPLPPVQIVRLPETITFGQFDASGQMDLVIGVTEYVNRSTISVGRAGSSVAATNQTGVLIRRRLITLFGTSTDAFHYRFDASSTAGSVSGPLANSMAFVSGASLRPPGATTAAYSPLLSAVISLDQPWEAQYTTTVSSVTVLSDNMLRSSAVASSAAAAISVVNIGFQPFPFSVQALDSPFYESVAKLARFQQSTLTMLRHDVSRDGGELINLRSDSAGQWAFGGTAVATSASLAWTTDAAALANLTALAAGNDLRSFLPSLTTGPHPCAVLAPAPTSPSSFGQSTYDLTVAARHLDASFVTLSTAQPQLEYAWQQYYATLAPAVLSYLNATDPSDPNGAPSRAAQQYTMLQHDLQVTESYTAGWTEGVRVSVIGLQMDHGDSSSNSLWNRIISSPITWVLVSVLVVVVAFLSWMVYRRRARLFGRVRQQHVLDEIRTVLDLGSVAMPRPVSPSNENPCPAPEASPSERAGDSSSAPQLAAPAAPPNTGLLSPATAAPPLLPEAMPHGVLVHAPRIAPPTAHETAFSDHSPSPTSSFSSSPAAATAASSPSLALSHAHSLSSPPTPESASAPLSPVDASTVHGTSVAPAAAAAATHVEAPSNSPQPSPFVVVSPSHSPPAASADGDTTSTSNEQKED